MIQRRPRIQHEGQQDHRGERPGLSLTDQPHQTHRTGGLQHDGCDRDFPDLAERPEAQFHAEHEEQQEHAELGEQSDALLILDKLEARRPEDQSGKNIADDGRLFQAGEKDAARKGDERDYGEG